METKETEKENRPCWYWSQPENGWSIEDCEMMTLFSNRSKNIDYEYAY